MHNHLQSCLTRMEALFMRHVFKAQNLAMGTTRPKAFGLMPTTTQRKKPKPNSSHIKESLKKATTTQDTNMTGRGIITTLTLGSSRTTICQQAMPICGEGRNTLTALRTADFGYIICLHTIGGLDLSALENPMRILYIDIGGCFSYLQVPGAYPPAFILSRGINPRER